MGKKADGLEIDRRVAQVLEKQREGWTSNEIVQHCSSEWKVTKRQAYDYIAKAYEETKNISKAEIVDVATAIVADVRHIHKLAMRDQIEKQHGYDGKNNWDKEINRGPNLAKALDAKVAEAKVTGVMIERSMIQVKTPEQEWCDEQSDEVLINLIKGGSVGTEERDESGRSDEKGK